MQNYIKRLLITVPMIFLLCISFINVNVYAEAKVDKQTDVVEADTSETAKNKNDDKSTENNSNKNEDNQNSNKNNGNSNKNNENSDVDDSENAEEETVVEEELPAWQEIDGKLYYVTEDGIVEETGWFKEKDVNPDADNDYEYYLDKKHAATIGWKKIKEDWYYFDEKGRKQTSWTEVDGNWYYLGDKGIMETGWITYNDERYYLQDSGIRAEGKKNIDDKWYFFDDDGILQTGTYKYDGKYYFSTAKGVMEANKWTTINDNKYYVKADSSFATSDAIIDNVMEKFDGSGKYLGTGEMEDHLFIKYLNVGNADCEFIKLPSGETVLIDTGDVSTSGKVIDFLKSQNLKKEDGRQVIDYIVITHGHSDHIGGLAAILDEFKVNKVYIPEHARMEDFASDVKVTEENASEVEMIRNEYEIFKEAEAALEDHDMEFTDTENGEFIDDEEILKFVQSDRDFGAIGSDDGIGHYWGINDNSAIVFLDYESLQVLFTADMEWKSEKYFWKNDLLDGDEIDILKIPHHGRDTSSTYDFVDYLNPTVGTISRAADNISKNEASNNLILNGVSLYEVSDNDGISIYATDKNWTMGN